MQLYDSLSDWISHEMEHDSSFQLGGAAYWHHSHQTLDAIPEQVYIRKCPFCSKAFNLESSFHHHVAAHLVRIAIFALPRSTSADQDLILDQREKVSDKVGADSASLMSRNKDFDENSSWSFHTMDDRTPSIPYDSDPKDCKVMIYN